MTDKKDKKKKQKKGLGLPLPGDLDDAFEDLDDDGRLDLDFSIEPFKPWKRPETSDNPLDLKE